MPRNDIFCNHLNLTQTILSQSQIVQGYTHFLKKILLGSKQVKMFEILWSRKQSTLSPVELLLLLSHALTNQLASGDSAVLKIYLITNEHMDSCWPLLVDLADLARGNAEKLSNFFCQFNSCQFFQVDGMVHCKRERAMAVSTKFICS